MVRQTVVIAMLLFAGSALADDIAVTVYNSNLGVVSETRTLTFDRGTGIVEFRDVPGLIDAASVRFELADRGNGVSILEQNYAYDLVSPDKLYEKYIDKQIELVDKEGRLFSGTLLAARGGGVTLMDKSGKVQLVMLAQITEVNFPELPGGLITRPTLFWKYLSDVTGDHLCKVGYQTRGLSWQAEYVGLLNEAEDYIDLSGWSSITNNSGKTFENATLKLVAGEIGRADQVFVRGGRKSEMMFEADGMAAGFEEKAFFEYHLYTLPRKSTVANNEVKQISLFEPAGSAVEKLYLYRPDLNTEAVDVVVKFINSKSSGLGMPLPEGRVRLFKSDEDGSLVLLGEDRINHTPKDEEVRLKVGTAFDIKGKHTMTNQRKISSLVYEQDFEMQIRNRKDEPVTVEVEKKLYGFWEITTSSQEYKKKDASTVLFDVPVPANDSSQVSMTVRFTTW